MKNLLIKLYAKFVNRVFIPREVRFFVMHDLTERGVAAVQSDGATVYEVHGGKGGHVVIFER